MTGTEIVIGILLLIMALFLIVSILMQSGKSKRLSGSIAGGAETFFGKQKGQAIDKTLSKVTNVVALIFVVLVLVLLFVDAKNDQKAADANKNDKTEESSKVEDDKDESKTESKVDKEESKKEESKDDKASSEEASTEASTSEEASADAPASSEEASAEASEVSAEASVSAAE